MYATSSTSRPDMSPRSLRAGTALLDFALILRPVTQFISSCPLKTRNLLLQRRPIIPGSFSNGRNQLLVRALDAPRPSCHSLQSKKTHTCSMCALIVVLQGAFGSRFPEHLEARWDSVKPASWPSARPTSSGSMPCPTNVQPVKKC